MDNLKDEKEVAKAVLEKAKKMLDEFLQKKEEKVEKMEGGSTKEDKKFDSCVNKVQEQGKDKPSAHAICTSSMKKTEKLRSFIAKKAQKRLAKCGEQKKV